MENGQKADLRFQKTEQAIREAFLESRKTLPLEKVKVRPLCQRARINASTFYAHYADIMELSDSLENELIQKCLPQPEDMKYFSSDPYRFIIRLRDNAIACMEELDIIFSGREETFHTKLEQQLLELFDAPLPSDKRIKLSFALGGIFHTTHMPSRKTKLPQDQLCKALAELVLKLGL